MQTPAIFPIVQTVNSCSRLKIATDSIMSNRFCVECHSTCMHISGLRLIYDGLRFFCRTHRVIGWWAGEIFAVLRIIYLVTLESHGGALAVSRLVHSNNCVLNSTSNQSGRSPDSYVLGHAIDWLIDCVVRGSLVDRRYVCCSCLHNRLWHHWSERNGDWQLLVVDIRRLTLFFQRR